MSAPSLARLALVGASLPFLLGATISLNDPIRIDAGSAAGDLKSINGGIRLGADARGGRIESVNGGIALEDDVRLQEVRSINGGVEAGARLEVEGTVSTVNGVIALGEGARIGGDLQTVNGRIEVTKADVRGKLVIVHGSIDTGADSRIGSIEVRRPQGTRDGDTSKPVVVVGPRTEVRGTILFEHEGTLWVHASATIGEVRGTQARRYDGERPPR